MKRKILNYIGLFSFIILMVGCGGGGSSDDTNSAPKAKSEMVVIPTGSFQMGNKNSPNGTVSDSYFRNEVPVHDVTIAAFQIGKHEVTFAEYDQYLQSKGIDISNITETSDEGYDNGWGRGNRPMINVSWDDIQGYLNWLNTQQGIALDDPRRYRLPTEAEWEYAARAGTEKAYSTGYCIDTSQANYNGDFSWNYMVPLGVTVNCPETSLNRQKTEPVGSFPANPFDLYDMHGNVWEWVEDCWHDTYAEAPNTGSAWLSEGDGDCSNRVVRGGSWRHNQWDLLSATRDAFPTDNRRLDFGFRLARSLTNNLAPTAKAGSNQSIKLGTKINLDASSSFDPEGNELSYTWRFTETPNGNTDSLSNDKSKFSSFTPSAVGEYKVELVVNDRQSDSAPDIVTITVTVADAENLPPIADAGQNREVISGDSITLNGGNSRDSDDSIVSYSWASEDTSISLSSANTATTTFIAPEVNESKTYHFELTVTDNDGESSSDTIVITVMPRKESPTANATADKTRVELGQIITLDASNSTNSNEGNLTYQWSVTSSPGSSALLSDPGNVITTFAPDVVGNYTIELTVSDGVSSDSTTVSLMVNTVSSFKKPEMIVIPGGSFMMGDETLPDGVSLGDDESWEVPVLQVSIATFEMGKYEVTFNEYDEYLRNRAINSISDPSSITATSSSAIEEAYDEGWGRGNRPVMNVTWDELQAYLDWLNTQRGIALDDPKRYRLPTEAEWEYAARAGTTTTFSWGNEVDHNKDNLGSKWNTSWVVDGTADQWVNTAPVGHFPANPFGLHDMHGNVEEWVEDCWHGDYTGAPDDGSAWVTDCNENIEFRRRVLRGGSWRSNWWNSRSAHRSEFFADSKRSYFGFRLARSLTNNLVPTAKAGSNQSIKLGTKVNLYANRSFDPEGKELSYTWRFILTPNSNTDSLSNNTAKLPSFTPSAVGEYKIELVVNDGQSDSTPDIITITVTVADAENLPPIADAGQNREVISGDSVTLNSDNSRDNDSNVISYSWASEDTSIDLSPTNTVTTTFIAPAVNEPKTYHFELIVTDNDGESSSDTIVITVAPYKESPIANATTDKTKVELGQMITLDASNSTNSNEGNLTYQWSVTSSPGSLALPSNPTNVTTTFVPDVVGSYIIGLMVSDGVSSDNTTVSLTVTAVNFKKPEMVVMPGGSFMMGDETSPDGVSKGSGDDGELPVHKVTIATFEMGKYEVTYDEYDEYLKNRAINPISDPSKLDVGWGRGNRPVINVYWGEIQGYLNWLNIQLGIALDDPKRYRLPTEAEWEYGARAGSTTAYSWGNAINHDNANYGEDGFYPDGLAVEGTIDQWVHTAPVGSFPANAWGLHDMHGNVWEQVEDCSYDYTGVPSDGSVRVTNCRDDNQMFRGGSWSSTPRQLRSSFRGNSPLRRIFDIDNSIGFRLARTL